jgi:3,4-dihydroxy 2-butanone 4-phosphate synthase / GTP cyclohydrolase II
MSLADISEIIDDARNGRMFILVDDEDRENEGDLVIPAQMAGPDAINFMARYGRGLICLALTAERVAELGLPPMTSNNRTRHATAFTVSIEAREGVSTGISASDRAKTVAAAIDGAKGRDDIVSPGHVFPLTSRPGGVLVRAGHTEAAVDVARIAGLNPSGVICEIMNDDGTMARLDDLKLFAEKHGLKIGTIRDLIAYRMRHDHNVEQVTEERFTSRHGGEWRAVTFYNKAIGVQSLALIKGELDVSVPVMVRMHGLDMFTDVLKESNGREDILAGSMEQIAQHGSGVVVLLTPQTGNMLSRFRTARSSEVATTEQLDTLRDYGIGAQILASLGISEIILLTNTHLSLVALSGYGLEIVAEQAIPPIA